MGYYIDFVFDEGITRDDVLKRIGESECVPVPLELNNQTLDEFWWSVRAGASPPWIARAQGLLVRVHPKQGKPPGNWAETRLSLCTSPDAWEASMAVVFGFADCMACRVWDGQVESFVTRADWESLILERLPRSPRGIAGPLGAFGEVPAAPLTVEAPRPRGNPAEEWDWSVRTANCLRRAGISSLDQLSQMTVEELRTVPNLGLKSLREIREQLALFSMSLKSDLKG